MGLFDKFKAGLQKTHSKLAHEIKRIVTRSPRLDAASLEDLEAALLAADLGMQMTTQIVEAVKKSYESQGAAGADVFTTATAEVEKSLSSNHRELRFSKDGPSVVSIVGVNGTGKTTLSPEPTARMLPRLPTTPCPPRRRATRITYSLIPRADCTRSRT